MPILPCLEKLHESGLSDYLKGKAQVHIDAGVPEKQAYINAARELQQSSLNEVKKIYSEIGLKGYEKGEVPPQPQQPEVVSKEVKIKKDLSTNLKEKGFIVSSKGGLEKDGVNIAFRTSSVLGVDKQGDVFNVDSPRSTDVVLQEIKIVDESVRGKGNATKVLKEFLNAADQEGKTIYIEPEPIAKYKNEKDITREQLINWYEKNGFEKKNDYVWVRKPKEIIANEQNKPTPLPVQNKVGEASGERGKETIPPQIIENQSGGEGEPIKGIKHAAMAETAAKAGLPPYEGHTPVTHQERLSEAKKTISENANVANEIMEKVEKGGNVTPQDNAVLAVYKGALDKELQANPSKELFDRISRIAKVLDPQGTYAGQLLESRKLTDFNEDNLSNFLLAKEAIQEVPLSEKQIKDESAKFTELKAAKDALSALEKADKEQYAKLLAELGVNKARAAARKASKKTHEEHIKDRKAIVDAAREDLKKLRESGLQSTIPGLRELKALAPHVKRYMQDLVNEGIDKFDVIINNIHAEFKDVLDGLRKTDVIDILRGSYDEKKQTRNEKAALIRSLKTEAKLVNKLADARKGEQQAKNEPSSVEKRRRIKELEDKIKEVKNNRKDFEDVEEKSFEKSADSKEYDRLVNRAKKLSYDLRNKRYAEEPKKPENTQLSRKTIIAKDKVIELEDRIRRERAKEDYAKRSKWLRYYDKIMQFLGIRRIVQSAFDISIPFRQGATLISPRRIDIWAHSFGKMLNSVFNPKKFSRLMYDIRHSEDYHDMTKDGIIYNEMDAAKPEAHNEDFQKSFIYQIPVVREPLLASNRAADAFLNTARYELYMKYKNNLQRQGMTRQSDPKAYKFAAKWAMDMTGRGLVHKSIDNKYMTNILGNTFYGAKLMASRFNLLNPVTYFDPRIPKEVRYGAMKDMASFTATVMATGLGLIALGGKVSLNPWDSDFLQVRFGNKVYDLSGGLSVYIRTFLRFVDAAFTRATGSKHEGNKKVKEAGKSVVKFWRNKLSPNTAYSADAFFGPSQPGKEFDPLDVVEIYPMYADDAIKALKEDGSVALLTVLLPNMVGVGYGNYASRGTVDTDLDTLLDRNMRSDEMNQELIRNYNRKGEPISDKEFDDFVDKRDSEIKKNLTELFNKGKRIVDDNYKIAFKPYNQLSQEEVIKETTRIKSTATRKIKEQLFGEQPEDSPQEKLKQDILDIEDLLPKLLEKYK